MTELTTLIDIFRNFLNSCMIEFELPRSLKNKLLAFNQLLNQYPQSIEKLQEYSSKLGEENKQIIESDSNLNIEGNSKIRNETKNGTIRKQQELKKVEGTYTSQKKNLVIKEGIKEIAQIAIQKMRNGTNYFKQRISCEKLESLSIKESCIGVSMVETIKKVDANQLRSKILIMDGTKEKEALNKKQIVPIQIKNGINKPQFKAQKTLS